jgi:hypothetical protein
MYHNAFDDIDDEDMCDETAYNLLSRTRDVHKKRSIAYEKHMEMLDDMCDGLIETRPSESHEEIRATIKCRQDELTNVMHALDLDIIEFIGECGTDGLTTLKN